MEVRRSEDVGGRDQGLRLIEQEREKKQREKEGEKRYIERKKEKCVFTVATTASRCHSSPFV